MLGPYVLLAQKLGKIAASLADSVERVEIEYLGRIAERDTRLLTLSVLTGLFTGRTEEAVNLVNAPPWRRSAGSRSPRRVRRRPRTTRTSSA